MKKILIKKSEKRQVVIDKSDEYFIELVGVGANVEVLGALIVQGNEKLNVDVKIIHKAPDTHSDTFIRAVARGRAKVNLKGIIKIEKKAQKTNAFLRENVLLLSNKAQADAIPNLEIEADDVKCSHAATVGKIDEEQIFYLMSRGLSRKIAEKIVVEGFLNAVRERITES